MFIISDGRFNKKMVKPLVVEAEEKHILPVFIILDQKEDQNSILNIKSTKTSYVEGKFVL
jgi:midasin